MQQLLPAPVAINMHAHSRPHFGTNGHHVGYKTSYSFFEKQCLATAIQPSLRGIDWMKARRWE
jgi:hypothetical protein